MPAWSWFASVLVLRFGFDFGAAWKTTLPEYYALADADDERRRGGRPRITRQWSEDLVQRIKAKAGI